MIILITKLALSQYESAYYKRKFISKLFDIDNGIDRRADQIQILRKKEKKLNSKDVSQNIFEKIKAKLKVRERLKLNIFSHSIKKTLFPCRKPDQTKGKELIFKKAF